MSIVLTLNATGRPKRDIIEMAYEECGSAGYEFERTPEEIASALRKLNTMMAEWPWSELGFTQPEYGQGSAADKSGIEDRFVHPVTLYLAMRLAPAMGATMSPESRAALARSYNLVVSAVSTVPTARMASNTPRGTGARGRTTFIRETD